MLWSKLKDFFLSLALTLMIGGYIGPLLWSAFHMLWTWYGWTLLDSMTGFVDKQWVPLTGVVTTTNWSAFTTVYGLANAWFPVTETIGAIAGLWGFRTAVATVKLLLRIWDAVPLKFS